MNGDGRAHACTFHRIDLRAKISLHIIACIVNWSLAPKCPIRKKAHAEPVISVRARTHTHKNVVVVVVVVVIPYYANLFRKRACERLAYERERARQHSCNLIYQHAIDITIGELLPPLLS